MIVQIDISNEQLARQVLPVQIEAYEVEAKIIDYADLPPLKETVESLKNCGETFFGFYEGEELCGAISVQFDDSILDIHRLIVSPRHFRRGIAQQLLNHVVQLYETNLVKVSTGARNVPAIQFYEKNGFRKVEDIAINERLSLTLFVYENPKIM